MTSEQLSHQTTWSVAMGLGTAEVDDPLWRLLNEQPDKEKEDCGSGWMNYAKFNKICSLIQRTYHIRKF